MSFPSSSAGVVGDAEASLDTSEPFMSVRRHPPTSGGADAPPARVGVEPRLTGSEIAFLLGFTRSADIRRLWPGQPHSSSPWRPSADGTCLELDEGVAPGSPEAVEWLRFLDRVFLAPCSPTALDRALRAGLRGGHRIDDHGGVPGVHVIAPTGWDPDAVL